MTRKLVETTFVSLDGVISNPQDWGGSKYWDDEYTGYVAGLLDSADSLLLGRKTYEGFLLSWPERSGDFADRMNSIPKHVASRSLTETSWNATVIKGDVADAVAAMKADDGGDILKFGTGEVDRTLFPKGLIDELHLWVFPVIAGSGERLMDGLETTHLTFLREQRLQSGIVVHVLRP